MGFGIPPHMRTSLFKTLNATAKRSPPEIDILAIDMASCLYSLVPLSTSLSALTNAFIFKFKAKHIVFCFEGSNIHDRRKVLHTMRYKESKGSNAYAQKCIDSNKYSYDILKKTSDWRNMFLKELERRLIIRCAELKYLSFSVVGKDTLYNFNANLPDLVVQEAEGEIRAFNSIRLMGRQGVLWTNDGDGLFMCLMNPRITTAIKMSYGDKKLVKPYRAYVSGSDDHYNAVFWLLMMFGGDYTYSFYDKEPKQVSLSSFGVNRKLLWDTFDFCTKEENSVIEISTNPNEVIIDFEKIRLLILKVPEISRYFEKPKKRSGTSISHFKHLVAGALFSVVLYRNGTSRWDFNPEQFNIKGSTFYEFTKTAQSKISILT